MARGAFAQIYFIFAPIASIPSLGGGLLIVTVTLVSSHLDYLFGAALERSTRSYI